MPLFSRIRKTVNSVKPKSSTSKSNGIATSSINYEPSHMRSTKSSSEKTLKPNNSIRSSTHTTSNSHRHMRNGGTSKVHEIDYAPRDGPLLRRSSTFTLEDEEIENAIPDRHQQQQYRQRHSSNEDDVIGNDEYRHRNAVDSNTHGRSRGKRVYILFDFAQ